MVIQYLSLWSRCGHQEQRRTPTTSLSTRCWATPKTQAIVAVNPPKPDESTVNHRNRKIQTNDDGIHIFLWLVDECGFEKNNVGVVDNGQQYRRCNVGVPVTRLWVQTCMVRISSNVCGDDFSSPWKCLCASLFASCLVTLTPPSSLLSSGVTELPQALLP